MLKWLKEYGEKPKRIVRPYWWSPTLILRQATSALFLGALSHWRKLPYWLFNYGFKCLPGAAGSKGMGCIGFPAHPVWEITRDCNLNCIHCHTRTTGSSTGELTTKEGKQLLNQLAKIKDFRMMAFTGGEPLIREDLYELLAYSKALGFTNTIATNATLIDDKIASKLKEHGVVIAAVSLDGFDAATHDMVRGIPGSFDTAIKGIKALSRNGILLHINITAMQYNLDQMKKMMALIENLKTGILLMYQLVPVGRGRQIEKAALDIHSNECLIRFIAQAQKTTNAIIEPVAGPQYWPLLLKQAGISKGLPLRIAESVFHGCSAARGFVYIKPNGEVWPCPFIEVNCGNIRDTPFSYIWKNSIVLNKLRNREILLKGQCADCEYKKLCGGCRGRALALKGNYLEEDPSCFIHNSNTDKNFL